MSVRFVVPVAALLALSACGELGMNYAADVGITPGGSQDIGFARGLIADGQIPDQEYFPAEGLFSEHDLPLSGDPCEALLCPRTAATIHRPANGDDKVLVQLGFGTNVDPATFVRDSQDLVFLVDTSGSMSGEKLELAKDGMLSMLDQLGERDRAALVEFGSRAKLLERARDMDDGGKSRLRSAIEALETNGSTDMESGMRKAYDQLENDFDGGQRLMIFSDAQPNTGLTAESDFVSLVRSKAEEGVGTTFFGIGNDLGTELADVISKVRGGSFHTLTSDSGERLFGDEFDYLVTPVAYDLEVRMSGVESARLGDEMFGAPVDGDEVTFGASTLFLSSRQGGMGATFDLVPDAPMTFGAMSISYVPVGEDTPVEQSVAVAWKGGAFEGEADDEGVYKMDALVYEYKALVAAAEACDGTIPVEDARAAVAHARGALAERGELLGGDAAFAVEDELMGALDALLAAESLTCAPADAYYY